MASNRHTPLLGPRLRGDPHPPVQRRWHLLFRAKRRPKLPDPIRVRSCGRRRVGCGVVGRETAISRPGSHCRFRLGLHLSPPRRISAISLTQLDANHWASWLRWRTWNLLALAVQDSAYEMAGVIDRLAADTLASEMQTLVAEFDDSSNALDDIDGLLVDRAGLVCRRKPGFNGG